VGQRVRAVVGLAAGMTSLVVLFEARTQRRTFALRQGAGGESLGEVALDESTFPTTQDAPPLTLHRVEVETSGESADLLKPLVKQLRRACNLRRARQSKFESGLAARGLTPIAGIDLGRTAVHADDTMRTLAYATLRRDAADMLALEPAARLLVSAGEDSAAIHAMRVAIRRQRAALSLFKEALPLSMQMPSLRDDLGWLGQSLGAVRDLDVQLEQLRAWQIDDPALLERLSQQRAQAHKQLLRAFNSARYQRFVAAYTTLLREGPDLSRDEQMPLREAMPALLQRAHRKLRRQGDALLADVAEGAEGVPASAYHQVRIKAKRLRYALEFVRHVCGKPAKRLHARLVTLQDTLGQLQDATVATDRLRALGLHTPGLRAAMQHYAQQAAAAREQFPALYARVRGKRRRILDF
jgi:CHAD domain-containing protein